MLITKQLFILVAEDDPDDCLLLSEAFAESELTCQLKFVGDGEALLEFLERRTGPESGELMPDLILLDLNMPKIDGREALVTIKNNPDLRHIPIIVMTTSHEKDDVLESYVSGTNSFIVKPTSFSGLKDVVNSIEKYWLQVSELPEKQ